MIELAHVVTTPWPHAQQRLHVLVGQVLPFHHGKRYPKMKGNIIKKHGKVILDFREVFQISKKIQLERSSDSIFSSKPGGS